MLSDIYVYQNVLKSCRPMLERKRDREREVRKAHISLSLHGSGLHPERAFTFSLQSHFNYTGKHSILFLDSLLLLSFSAPLLHQHDWWWTYVTLSTDILNFWFITLFTWKTMRFNFACSPQSTLGSCTDNGFPLGLRDLVGPSTVWGSFYLSCSIPTATRLLFGEFLP